METRAHHLLIGTFMLLFSVGLVMFFLWLAKTEVDTAFTEYDIYFEESVAGMARGSDVRYNGIPVGEVRTLTIAPDDPSKVRVGVRIRSEIPIKTDSVAVLALQGVTGVAFVLIEGGSSDSPRLLPTEGQDRAVIPSRVSPFQELFEGAPDLINQTAELVRQLKNVLSDENVQNISSMLDNGNRFSSELVGQGEKIEALLVSSKETVDRLAEASVQIERFVENANGLMDNSIPAVLTQVTDSLSEAQKLIVTLEDVAEKAGAAVGDVNVKLMPETLRLIGDLRRTALALADMAERLEANPAQLIVPDKKPLYQKN